MPTLTRRHLYPAAALVGAAALIAGGATVALGTAPTFGRALAAKAAPAIDATTLNGYRANDLGRAVMAHDANPLSNFDSCDFTTELTRTLTAPHDGYIVATGNVSAARQSSNENAAELAARLTAGNATVSSIGTTPLSQPGIRDSSIAVEAMAPVSEGKVVVNLQLSECTPGAAYITDRAITVQFVPFGDVTDVPISPVGKGANR